MTLGDWLLAPTRIYVRSVLALTRTLRVHALAHITGGGITENLPRVLPQGTCAQVDLTTWNLSPVFDWIQNQGGISDSEMLRTFNCGIGMVICVAPDDAESALEQLRTAGEDAWVMGSIAASGEEPRVIYSGGPLHV